jgi:hypothetical protein
VSSWCEMHRNVCYRLDVSVSVAFSVSDRPSVRNHCWEYINCCLVEFRLIYSKIRCDVKPFGNRNHSFAENFWTVLLFFFFAPPIFLFWKWRQQDYYFNLSTKLHDATPHATLIFTIIVIRTHCVCVCVCVCVNSECIRLISFGFDCNTKFNTNPSVV